MKYQIRKILFLALFCYLIGNVCVAEQCTTCHKESFKFSPFHSPYVVSCEQCHGGNPDSDIKEIAHFNLEAYPGNMQTLSKSCGQARCHAELIPMVENSIMHTVDGMISVTRQVYQENKPDNMAFDLGKRLDNEGADQYLRKLCVSCHLGSERKNHEQSFRDRGGGGCSACHLQTYQQLPEVKEPNQDPDITGSNKTHPTLTTAISNDRCFGCHARSGRISMNYMGLAEVETIDQSRINDFGRLYDNRLVERKAADVHYLAGMACIDCHTVNGLMGVGKRVPFLRFQTDIQCDDCHAEILKTKRFDQLTPRERKYTGLYKDRFPISPEGTLFVTAKAESPLLHLQEKEGRRVLVLKLSGKALDVPIIKKAYYHTTSGHERLSCDSCHTAWAPQCYGCHVTFSPSEKQFDHTQGEVNAGRWIETRWEVKSDKPALGVFEDNVITTFVPGMNLIIKKTPQAKPFEQRIFSATSAHTTQSGSRDCQSCHSSNEAVGIIEQFVAHPKQKQWVTPVGWIEDGQKNAGRATKPRDRSFTKEEIVRIRQVGSCLKCHDADDPIYQDYFVSLKNQIDACKE